MSLSARSPINITKPFTGHAARRWGTIAALFTRWPLAWLTVAFLALVFLMCLPGCSTAEIDKAIEHQKQQRQEVELQLAQAVLENKAIADAKNQIAAALDAERNKENVNAAKVNELEKKLATAVQLIEEKNALAAKAESDKRIKDGVIAEMEKLKAAAGNPGQQIGEGMQTVGRFVPAPWGELLGLAGIAVAGFSERRRKKDINAATEAVGVMSTAIAGGLVELKPEAKRALNEVQSDAAKRFVKQVQLKYAQSMNLAAASPGRTTKAP